MNRNIPGVVDYSRLAQRYRPDEPAKLRDEVRRLAREQKLSARDISASLKINLVVVNEWLAGADHAG
jgi:hypothetical protein